MSDRGRVRTFLTANAVGLLTPLLAFLIFFLALIFYGSKKLKALTFFGLEVDKASGLLGLFALYAAIAAVFLGAMHQAAIALYSAYRRRYRPYVGDTVIAPHRLAQLIEALDNQAEVVRSNTTWPRHEPQAQAARSVKGVHFGDARLSTPAADLRDIRRFLARPARGRKKEDFSGNVMLVTGEPGAGKSILTQEMHASLVAGLKGGHHSLIPLIIFASDLSLDLIGEAGVGQRSLQQLLSRYFRRKSETEGWYRSLAEVVDGAWNYHDFLIIVDGLDEIAQRSAYEAIQRQLRAVLEVSFSPRKHALRVIMSCRLDDDLAVFQGAQSIVLRGLHSERERQRFCDNLIRNAELPKSSREILRRTLRRTSHSLSSVDIFRRNPYFLALLLDHFRKPERMTQSSRIDFDHLMMSYIKREVEREHAPVTLQPGSASPQRAELRRSLERVSAIFLQYMAFHMTASDREDSLYGQCLISSELVDGFAECTSGNNGALEGPWPTVVALLDELEKKRSLDAETITKFVSEGHFDENDLRIFVELAQRPRQESAEAILSAFAIIAREGRIEAPSWYEELSRELAGMAASRMNHPRHRAAVLLLARGLAAAHVLRLVYIEKDRQGTSARFRHRRLAEYFAACYFRDRWNAIERMGRSQWLIPILNLVAAIEGDRCRAMNWFVQRVKSFESDTIFLWRERILNAAEAAGFAARSKEFYRLLEDLAQGIIKMLLAIRTQPANENQEATRDIVTEITLVNALAYIGGLDLNKVEIAAAERTDFLNDQMGQPASRLLHFAKAARATAELTHLPTPMRYRLALGVKALFSPIAILPYPREAFRIRIGAQWVLAAIYVLAVEIALAWLLAQGLSYLLARALPLQSLPAIVPKLLTGGMLMVWAVGRVERWVREPSKAAGWAAIPLGMLVWSLKAIWMIARALFLGARALPEITTISVRAIPRILEFLFTALLICLAGAAIFGIVFGIVTAVGALLPATPETPPNKSQPAQSTSNASTSPATKVSDEMCEGLRADAKVIASMSLPTPLSWQIIDQNRALITERMEKIRKANIDNSCHASDRTGGNLETEAAAEAIDRSAYLMPVSSKRPLFGPNDFAALDRALKQAPPRAPAGIVVSPITALTVSLKARDQSQEMAAKLDLLRNSLAKGRVTELNGQRYATGESFQDLVVRVTRIRYEGYKRVERLDTVRLDAVAALWRSIFFAVLVLGTSIYLIRLARNVGQGRYERRTLASLARQSPEDICKRLSSPTSSDWLRSRLQMNLAKRELSLDEIAQIEETAQVLGARRDQRDQALSQTLGAMVVDLSRRHLR